MNQLTVNHYKYTAALQSDSHFVQMITFR